MPSPPMIVNHKAAGRGKDTRSYLGRVPPLYPAAIPGMGATALPRLCPTEAGPSGGHVKTTTPKDDETRSWQTERNTARMARTDGAPREGPTGHRILGVRRQ